MAKYRAILDRIVHHFFVPGTEPHKVGVCLSLFLCPFLTPDRFTISINRHNLRQKHTLGMCQVIENRCLGNEVAHHNEATTTHVKRTEKGFFHPVGKVMHTLLITAKLIIVKVINDNVVWTCLTITQTTW